jgi:hypothetical protein
MSTVRKKLYYLRKRLAERNARKELPTGYLKQIRSIIKKVHMRNRPVWVFEKVYAS